MLRLPGLPTPRIVAFVQELHRRRVGRAAVLYVVVGTAVIAAANDIAPNLSLPLWTVPLVIVLAGLGLPIVLVLAWAHDLHPGSTGVPTVSGGVAASLLADPASGGAAAPVFAADRPGIVVLPFDNLSPEASDAYFSDGLTEEIIATLSCLRGLRVISRNSAMALKAAKRDTGEIARQLGVRYVLEGSVRKAGEALRITAQLIDAESDDHLWAERYDGSMGAVLDIQEQVARAIAGALELRLSSAEERQLAGRLVDDPTAYDCYLRARYELWMLSAEGVARGLELVNRGLQHSPGSPLLLVMRGTLLDQHVNVLAGSPGTYAGLLDRALEDAEQALRMRPDYAAAFYLKGIILHQRGRPAESVPLVRRAVALAPDDADYAMMLGYQLAASGREMPLARALLLRSMDLDPLTPMFRGSLGFARMFTGDYATALEGWTEWRESCERGRSAFRLLFAWLHAAAGSPDESLRLLRQVSGDSAGQPTGALAAFFSGALAGDRVAALAARSPEMEAAAAWDDLYSLMVADAYALLGESDTALRWLDQAIDYGFTDVHFLGEHEPFLSRLRRLPAFRRALERADALADRIAAAAAASVPAGAA